MSLRTRVPIAFFMLAFVIVSIQFLSPLGLFLVIQILILASLVEFYNLTRKRKHFPQEILGCLLAIIISLSFLFEEISLGLALFVCLLLAGIYYVISTNRLEKLAPFTSSFAITLLGPIFLSFPLNHFYLLKVERDGIYIYFLLAIVIFGDTGAYTFGKLWGRRKILPIASPRKTWMGGFGGILFACLAALIARELFLGEIVLWKAILCGFFVHVVAQISDPLESLFKRAVGVKDSSRLLLGHGGFFDRLDSLILSTPFFYHYIKYFW